MCVCCVVLCCVVWCGVVWCGVVCVVCCVCVCLCGVCVCVCVCVCFGLAQRRDQYSIEYFFPAMNDVPESRGYRY